MDMLARFESIPTIYTPDARHLCGAPKPLSCSTLEASNSSTSLASSNDPENSDKAINPMWCLPGARKKGSTQESLLFERSYGQYGNHTLIRYRYYFVLVDGLIDMEVATILFI